MQREITTPGGVLQLAPKQIYTSSVIIKINLRRKFTQGFFLNKLNIKSNNCSFLEIFFQFPIRKLCTEIRDKRDSFQFLLVHVSFFDGGFFGSSIWC